MNTLRPRRIVERRQLSAATRALAGEAFVLRAVAAASQIAPAPMAARIAFAQGPEISGGEDAEPTDE